MNELVKKEYEYLVRYYESYGGNSRALFSNEYASMVINGDKILAKNIIDGIEIITHKIKSGVYAKIIVKRGHKVKNPVHLCFGMLPKEGKQIIKSEIIAEEGSSVKFLAHCIFPNAVKVEHFMESKIYVERGAKIEYEENHFHGKNGGVRVISRTFGIVENEGEYNSSFVIKSGRVGFIDINYEIHLKNNAKSMLISKIYGRGDDKIRVDEGIYLEGNNSTGVIKTRIALRNKSRSEVVGKMVGLGAYSRGHVDCTEIIMDEAEAIASPVVMAKNPQAKVTHEAAIGSVDKKQMLTLMARGLNEEEAVDVIVNGLLK